MAKLTNSPRQTVTLDLERRKSFMFQLSVVDADGQPADLTGCTLRFVLKPVEFDNDDLDSTNLIINEIANITSPEEGYGIFSFQAAELDFDPGEYYGTIVLWTASGYSISLLKVLVNLLENTESFSMYQGYSSEIPPSEIEVTLRGASTISVTTTNFRPDSVYRGPAVRSTTVELNHTVGQLTQLSVAALREVAYPNGRAVELRDGDMIFQEGTSLRIGLVLSIDSGVASVLTIVSNGG